MRLEINLGSKQATWLSRSRTLALVIRPILNAVVKVNRAYIRSHQVPKLYDSGVRYEEEPKDTIEEFAAIPVVLSRGWGDCDDLAPWRVAELLEEGESASIRIQWKKTRRGRLFHIVVRRANGDIEDPSAILGMYERTGG